MTQAGVRDSAAAQHEVQATCLFATAKEIVGGSDISVGHERNVEHLSNSTQAPPKYRRNVFLHLGASVNDHLVRTSLTDLVGDRIEARGHLQAGRAHHITARHAERHPGCASRHRRGP